MSRPITCRECGDECEQTGRMTWYCPSCDTCPTCNCPAVDGFLHNAGCADAQEDDTMDDDDAPTCCTIATDTLGAEHHECCGWQP